MKKILFSLMILVSSNSFAEFLTCPNSIRCNYEKGICDFQDKEKWDLMGYAASESFHEETVIQLYAVNAYKNRNGKYVSFACAYGYGKYSFIYLNLSKAADNIHGNSWEFYGFGNQYAKCSAISNTNECAVEVNE